MPLFIGHLITKAFIVKRMELLHIITRNAALIAVDSCCSQGEGCPCKATPLQLASCQGTLPGN